MQLRTIALCLIAFIALPAYGSPKIKQITLKKHVTLELFIVPDLGIRFVFPFVLDEKDEFVPFTLSLTNKAFAHKREEGRNSFVVTIPPPENGARPPSLYSNLFVTVAGYEITIELRSTHDLSKHYSDVVFEMGDGARETLIQQGIKQRTKALEKQYTDKIAAVEKQADQRALSRVGLLALNKPESNRIKEEAVLTFDGRDKFVLYVDNSLTFGPYTAFVFDVENKGYTSAIGIQDVKLFTLDPKTKQARPIDGAAEFPDRINPRGEGRGVITVLNSSIPGDRAGLQLHVVTDKGAVYTQW